jgi:H+/Cl- antiporter ClcA
VRAESLPQLASLGLVCGLLAALVMIAFRLIIEFAHGFYAVIGLGAMMGGMLLALLAALTEMLELTSNPNIIWPGMLAVIAAADALYLPRPAAAGTASVYGVVTRADIERNYRYAK